MKWNWQRVLLLISVGLFVLAAIAAEGSLHWNAHLLAYAGLGTFAGAHL